MRKRNLPLDSRNSPLELHSADFANFGRSQTISLVSRPKFAKNYESQTENPSVVFYDSSESSVESSVPSLRDSTQRVESWQSTKNNTDFRNAIVITGGIATGKSTACNILRLHGYSIIDMDKISHEMLESSKDEVVSVFGDEILECDSSVDLRESKINRKKLGEIVFNNKAKLATLESILHPKIRAEVEKKAKVLDAQNITYFIDIPIFFELQAKGCGYAIPRVLLIYAPKEVQLARMQKRDNLSAQSAQIRLSHQIDIESKRHKANFVIENTGNIRDLQSKIEAFLREI